MPERQVGAGIGSLLTRFGVFLALLVVAAVIYGYVARPGWVGVAHKTLWDWLELFIVPIVLAGAGFWLSNAAERERQLQQREQELVQENERAQSAALQAYLDQMNSLMVDKQLRLQAPDSDEIKLAESQTSAILMSLDGNRKRIPLRLVYQLGLIQKGAPIFHLKDAPLATADLSEIALLNASLKEVDLRTANLWGADLEGVDLSGADLRGANLSEANLSEANLLPYDKKSPAKLTAPYLSRSTVDPSDIDLSEDHVISTNLRGADLSNADLSGAYLTGTEVSKEQLAKCKSLQGATMPDGQNYEDWLKNKGRGDE